MTELKTLQEIAVEYGFDVKRIYDHIKVSLADQNLSPEAFDKTIYRKLSQAVYPDLHPENTEIAKAAFQLVNEKYNPENKKSGVSSLFKKKERVVVAEQEPEKEDPLRVELKKLLRKKHDYLARAESSAIADTNSDFQRYVDELAATPDADAKAFFTNAIAYEKKAVGLIGLIKARVDKGGAALKQEDLRPVYTAFYSDPEVLAARTALELKAKQLIEDYQEYPHRLQTAYHFRRTFSQADLEPLRSSVEEEIHAHKAFAALPHEKHAGEAEALKAQIAKELEARRAYLPLRVDPYSQVAKYDGVFHEFSQKDVHVDFLKTILQVEHELTDIARMTHTRNHMEHYVDKDGRTSAEFEKIRETLEKTPDPVTLVMQFKELQQLKLDYVAAGNGKEARKQRAMNISSFASPSSYTLEGDNSPAAMIDVVQNLIDGQIQRKPSPKSWERR